tara:strand:+ start:3036 stop:3920 length:885 start_codon:yes stop_codon:yes gene_type:complete
MNYIISNSGNVCAIVDGTTYAFSQSHPSYHKLLAYLKNKNVEYFEAEFNVAQNIANYCDGYIQIEKGQFLWNDVEMPELFADRILQMKNEGVGFEPMLNFLDNMAQNPSDKSILELFDFMQNKNLPITADGHFLAYKAVSSSNKDLYTGTIDNNIGDTPEVPRESVDANRSQHCGNGLHVGAIDYVTSYGGIDLDNPDPNTDDESGGNKIMICKVNPRDVVSVPNDVRFQKLRCCRYEVVAKFDTVFDKSVYFTSTELDRFKTLQYTREWNHKITARLRGLVNLLNNRKEKVGV